MITLPWDKNTLCERRLKAWRQVPRAAFIASWISTGFFERSQFPEGDGMSYQDAIETLDSTGLLRCAGIRDDMAGSSMQPNRPEVHGTGLTDIYVCIQGERQDFMAYV